MLLREDLLQPISGDNPSGVDVKYVLYDKIQEARRQDDDLAQGDWQRERKLSNFPEVVRLAQEGLATRSKDLKIAAWMAEALVHTDGFAGMRQGLVVCCGLIRNFWDTLYPPIEDGDLEDRAAPLEWLNSSTEIPLKFVPVVKDGFNWFQYKESRLIPYDDPKLKDPDKKLRAKRLAEGKIPPEAVDKSFAETPKAFYVQAEKDLDGCLATLRELNELCTQKFGDSAPSFGKLQITLEEIRHTIHLLLEKKRETEPDPVEPPAAARTDVPVAAPENSRPASAVTVSVASSEPSDRRDAIAKIAAAAAFLRKREPQSPAPFLMMRGLRWGELRAGVAAGDVTVLEAPPTELRQHIKRLAVGQRWSELLEQAEQAMALPCSRGWLDLQRMVVEACNALGGAYQAIAAAIQSELKALLTDVPQLLDANLMDDTPAANPETRAWLKQFLQSAASAGSTDAAPATGSEPAAPVWPARPADPYKKAREALTAGQPEKAFELLTQEIARQNCGRGRFHRKLQLVQLCIQAGKEAVAQPLLDDLLAAIELHKLEDWEEKETIAEALAAVLTSSKKIQGNAAEKQKVFDRICRLDPVRALGVSG